MAEGETGTPKTRGVQEQGGGVAVDWFLQNLIRLVNEEAGGSIGITVTVDGFLVSGLMVGGKEYFEAFARLFVGGFKGLTQDTAAKLEATFSGIGKIYDEPSDLLPEFLHLKDARVFHPDGSVAPSLQNPGVWWRVRVAAVSAFTLGTMSLGRG